MPLIECTAGPVESTVGGTNYSFQRDQFMRYVSQVYNERHVECFLGSDLYRVVDAVPVEKVELKKAPAVVVAPEPPLTPPAPPAPVFTPPPPAPVLPIAIPAPDGSADGVSQGSALGGLTPPVPPVVSLPPVVAPVPPIPPVVAAPPLGLAPPTPPVVVTLPNAAPGLTVTTPLGEKTATPVVKAPKNRAARRRGK